MQIAFEEGKSENYQYVDSILFPYRNDPQPEID
jgi:DNA replication protein DnaD